MNQSTLAEFFLMGFSNDRDGQIMHFVMFSFIYLIAIIGNVLLVITVALNCPLHTPMYFFLANLSLSDICYISTTIPKSMAISLTDNKVITFTECVAQVFSIFTFAGSELALLTIMAYDRYVAICHPLQYSLILNWDACMQMAAASWLTCMIHALLETVVIFQWKFCRSHRIEQFFCEVPHLQEISCSDTRPSQILIFVIGSTFSSICCGIIFISYGYIFSAVLKIHSIQGKYKAFSTCIPHLIVFTLFISTTIFVYMRQKGSSSYIVDLLSAVFYTVLPPLLNPIIYSFRNKDIQKAMWNIGKKWASFPSLKIR
ncbi:putative olfactory receptor 14L1 [Protobothrops mucrosquamatus]|uniref:putative olfactory receptor 14L1 n=1 Tax=Protobothrops mucrosquamatus TaxID=103944 RepID=UPI0010FBA0F1|nr:putative olfactory receptor 14L1 [Protobothrops mucrosquamatus]